MGICARLLDHQPAGERAPPLLSPSPCPRSTILVPSYKEDPRVVLGRSSGAASGLSGSPARIAHRRPPPHPTQPSDVDRLAAAAHSLPNELGISLEKPAEHFAGCLGGAPRADATKDRSDHPAENRRLAELYGDAAAWFRSRRRAIRLSIMPTRLFVELTFAKAGATDTARRPEWGREGGIRMAARRGDLLQEYRRLGREIQVEVTSFERKRFVNLSHGAKQGDEISTATSRSSGDSGGSDLGRRACPRAGRLRREADLSVPHADYLLMLDADTASSTPNICCACRMSWPSLDTRQWPLSRLRTAPFRMRRACSRAGGRRHHRYQYVIHQGFTSYGATFWVGANALARKSVSKISPKRAASAGYPIRRFIRTARSSKTRSRTIDLIARGWRSPQLRERLAFSATPPDFRVATHPAAPVGQRRLADPAQAPPPSRPKRERPRRAS